MTPVFKGEHIKGRDKASVGGVLVWLLSVAGVLQQTDWLASWQATPSQRGCVAPVGSPHLWCCAEPVTELGRKPHKLGILKPAGVLLGVPHTRLSYPMASMLLWFTHSSWMAPDILPMLLKIFHPTAVPPLHEISCNCLVSAWWVKVYSGSLIIANT